MSKRYRNGFKRTLCRWRIPTPSTSYRNFRSNGYNNNNNNTPLSPTLACTNNLRHQRLTYSNNNNNNNPKSEKRNNSFCHRRDNIFTFSMSKYKFVIGSRTLANHAVHSRRRRTSFHYRFSLIEQQERDEQQQQLQLQLQQRKLSMNVIQPRKHRAKFIFRTGLPPTTPPNSSISDTKNLSNGNHSKH